MWRPPRWGLGGGGVDVQGRMPASTPSEAVESARILKLVCIVEMNTSCEMETINIFKHHTSKDQATSTLMKQAGQQKEDGPPRALWRAIAEKQIRKF